MEQARGVKGRDPVIATCRIATISNLGWEAVVPSEVLRPIPTQLGLGAQRFRAQLGKRTP